MKNFKFLLMSLCLFSASSVLKSMHRMPPCTPEKMSFFQPITILYRQLDHFTKADLKELIPQASPQEIEDIFTHMKALMEETKYEDPNKYAGFLIKYSDPQNRVIPEAQEISHRKRTNNTWVLLIKQSPCPAFISGIEWLNTVSNIIDKTSN